MEQRYHIQLRRPDGGVIYADNLTEFMVGAIVTQYCYEPANCIIEDFDFD